MSRLLWWNLWLNWWKQSIKTKDKYCKDKDQEYQYYYEIVNENIYDRIEQNKIDKLLAESETESENINTTNSDEPQSCE